MSVLDWLILAGIACALCGAIAAIKKGKCGSCHGDCSQCQKHCRKK